MCVQEVSWGVLSWDVCMVRVVLRPNTEPVDTESDGKNRGRRERRSIHLTLSIINQYEEPCYNHCTRGCIKKKKSLNLSLIKNSQKV